MATTDFTAREPAGSAVFRSVSAAFSQAAALWRSYRGRRAISGLLAFDERMLSDIGITPGDVHSAMALPVSADPSTNLAERARERRMAQRARLREARNHEPRRPG